MKITTLEQLNTVKRENFDTVHMRKVGEMHSSDIVDVWVLGGDNYNYSETSRFIKKIYDFYKEKDISNVRVVYRNLGFGDCGYDIKINNKGTKYFINDTTIDDIDQDLEEIYTNRK